MAINLNNQNIALIGNPNSGKTTVFNYLTKSNQSTGNWPGVTVNKYSGSYIHNNQNVNITDLPGVYSLNLANNNAEDQVITCEYLYDNQADLFINIIDASNLKRSLYLTLQLLETGKPCLIILNMMDKIRNAKAINVKKLEKLLKTPIFCLNSNKKNNLEELKAFINNTHKLSSYNNPTDYIFSKLYKYNINNLALDVDANFKNYELSDNSRYNDINSIKPIHDNFIKAQLLEQNPVAIKAFNKLNTANNFLDNLQNYVQKNDVDFDILIADLRYKAIHNIYTQIIEQPDLPIKDNAKSKFLDKFLLHKYLGLPIFLLFMYLTFEISISLGAILKIPIEAYSNNIIPVIIYNLLKIFTIPDYINSIISNGITYGVTTTLGFIPQIFLIYVCLAILEESGYMARAAFVMDRIMQIAKLPGKSFIPLIIGFGCNVPAIYATRTLENKNDRIITALMTPFMSCGARLAIFIVFASTFFPNNTGLIIFSLYIIGIAIGLLTSIILKKTLLQDTQDNHTILEIPDYNIPNIKNITKSAFNKLLSFIKQAGKIILFACLFINIFNHVYVNSEDSVLSYTGKKLAPIFKPIGIEPNNWPAVVGIMTGAIAKEVTIGSLNTLYNNNDSNTLSDSLAKTNIIDSFKNAYLETKNNLADISEIKFLNPVTANAGDVELNATAQNQLSLAFGSKAAAFAYCIFLLLYIPCISTFAALKSEIGKFWAYFSLTWSTSIAYSFAGIFYQLSNVTLSSFYNIFIILAFNILLFFTLKFNKLENDYTN